MIEFRSSAFRLAAAVTFLLACSVAVSSAYPRRAQYNYPEREIYAHDLPALTAPSQHSTDMLATAVASVLHDKDVCCGRDSALADSLERADHKSLKDVADRLQGRHLLGDGRPMMVTAEYLTPDQVAAGHLIAMLAANHAPLMMWNAHVFVVHGVSYVESLDPNTQASLYTIHKFFLWDTRYSDARREAVFDRLTEDISKVQGLLFLEWKPQ